MCKTTVYVLQFLTLYCLPVTIVVLPVFVTRPTCSKVNRNDAAK